MTECKLLLVDYTWNEHDELKQLLETFIPYCIRNVTPETGQHVVVEPYDYYAIRFRCTDDLEPYIVHTRRSHYGIKMIQEKRKNNSGSQLNSYYFRRVANLFHPDLFQVCSLTPKAMETPQDTVAEDVYLNVFPLFEKPSYHQDAKFSNYLQPYLEYLASDLPKQLPGLDPLFVSSVRDSFRGTLEVCQAIEDRHNVVGTIRSTLNSLTNGNFLVLHFPHHSCDIVVFPDKELKDHLVFVPMELRRTTFSSAEPVEESGFTRAWRIALPKAMFQVPRAQITDKWIGFAADFQSCTAETFPGVYPRGTGRASALPETRKPPTPTYIIEWLLPELSKITLPVDESIVAAKTISSLKNFVGQGIPWRRSVHWNSIRFSVALAQRWYGYPLEQYKIMQLGFKTWLACRYDHVKGLDATAINSRIETLQRISLQSQRLSALNSTTESVVSVVLAKCEPIQKQVDQFNSTLLQQREARSFLPDGIDIKNLSGRFSLLEPVLKSLKEGSNMGLSSLKEEVLTQVSPEAFLEAVDAATALKFIKTTIVELKQTKMSISKQKPDLATFSASLILHGTEVFIYHLFNNMQQLVEGDLDKWAIRIRELLHNYALLIPSLSTSTPEHKSREVLAMWCATALIDHVARKQWPKLLKRVGMPLPIELLENLTFRERSLMETAANLIKHKKSLGTNEGLFNYKQPSATQQFAIKYFDSVEGSAMQNLLVEEREREVKRKEEREQQLRIAQKKYENLEKQQCQCGRYWNGYRYYFSECNRCVSITELLRMDHVVTNPLPESDHTAKEVIFFASQPTIFKCYGSIVLLAYMIHGTTIRPFKDPVDCVSWSLKQGLKLYAQRDTQASLISTRKTLGKDSHFKKLASFMVDVIHPDFVTSVAFMVGNIHYSISAFDPDISQYQYQLTGALNKLPWMADAKHTENTVLASQHDMPVSMTKSEFISFGRVRAAPNLQIRELVMTLQSMSDKCLNNGDFLTLARRVLYELGPITDRSPALWAWKLDLFNDTWLAKLHQALVDKLSSIRQNWQSHSIMRLIIEIAVFVAQFSREEFATLIVEARVTILEWIDEVNVLITEFIDKPEVANWRLLLIRLYSYLLLGSLEMTAKDLEYRSELARLKSICTNITPDIVDLLASVDSHVFNNTINIHQLIKSDTSIIDRLIAKIGVDIKDIHFTWTRDSNDGKHIDWYTSGLYRVNPISGLILYDGLTVSELPSVIVQTPIYQQVFKSANFIVQRIDNEYISSPFDTRKFKFGLWIYGGQQYPLIREQCGDGREFTLLPQTFLDGSSLPAKLVAEMSHWIDFKNNVIEFRAIDFRQTDCEYQMKLDSQECFINDIHESQLLNAHDAHLQELMNILTRINPVSNMMCFKSSSANNEFKLSYLKYNLTFTVQGNGDIVSDNYPGYKLAPKQLVETFPLFTEYLLVQPQSIYSTKLPLVLIPHGTQIHPYELDKHHRRLIPSTTVARLILADIYAKNSCTIDLLTKTTGLEQAYLLLQQCWQNSPYSTQEFALLSSLIVLPETSPIVYAIKLLVYYLDQESKQVSFLHPSGVITTPHGEWKDIFENCARKYFKTKHLLAAGETLAAVIEQRILQTHRSISRIKCNGHYFTRVPRIFFSKETLPSSFNIVADFQGTRVSPLVGNLPSEWSKQTVSNAQLYFWFIQQMQTVPQDLLLPRLTFLMHKTVLKGDGRGELLQCLYCTLTTRFCFPDKRLLSSEAIYNTAEISKGSVVSLTPSWEDVNRELAWELYKPILDSDLRPTAFYHEMPNQFRRFNVNWSFDFTTQLRILHDQGFIGRLFLQYAAELSKRRAFNGKVVTLIELDEFQLPNNQPSYQWPSCEASSKLELEPLNSNSNGFEFFDNMIKQFYKSIDAQLKPLVDLKLLRSRESEILEKLNAIAKDRTKAAERRALNDELDKVQEIISEHEAGLQQVNFPLKNKVAEGSEELQSKIVNELKDSYQKHIQSQQPAPEIDTDLTGYLNLKTEVDERRDQVWKEIERLLTSVDLPLVKLWQLTNLLMKPHQRIVPSLLKSDDHQCQLINPCICNTDALHELALHFAVLQVHSIKLGRVIELLDDMHKSENGDHDGFKSQLYTELSDKREWNPRANPGWLIFELERKVCIRSIQVEIASKMLNEKNIVLQLNMGEGKSKVIVPILCSILANGQTLVRVNVLSSLFHEVHSYLKLALGNMLGKRIYVFPFRRHVSLNSNTMEVMRRQLEECRAQGGIILSTPEHRLSLQLKYREVLWQYNHTKHNDLTADSFKGVIDAPILELLDESDEILRHKYQLIYTLGDQQSIEGGSSRWNVHLALVRSIFMANLYQVNRVAVPEDYLDNNFNGPTRLERLYHTMRNSTAHFIFHSSPEEPHVLPVVRLINEDFFDELREDLFKVFQLDPVWRNMIKGKSTGKVKEIEEFVMNNYANNPDGDKKCEIQTNEIMRDKTVSVPLLVLRGLLSFEILKTSLTRRHRIHYGIDATRKVPMAVPFRGKDTPAEGVEFGQPDMAITLTILAHSTEIDLAAVKTCFTYLKTKGINEQREIYKTWYKISQPIMSDKFVNILEKIEAVNVENVNMMQHLALYFGRNFEVIAYYLDNFVLPMGTRSFPEKIVANSWDLAKSADKVVGFSGTDDTKHTLPLYVRQIALPSVETTNGKMVDVLTNEKLGNTQYKSLPKEFESERILRQMCNSDIEWNVLIDSGALIEGMSNREVVERVLKICPRFQTGIFFDESNRLALIDSHGNSAQLNSSRPLELSCFTYLDDIHTRGTDLPFPTKSHAFVTVATGITKDKLMQACMRMRKLVHGLHKVTFWGTSEVTMKIQHLGHNQELAEADITSTHILEWVVENTIKAQEEAIITYASQGFHHYAASMALQLLHNNPNVAPPDVIKAVVLKELLETSAMYGIPLKTVNMRDHINQHGTSTKGNLLGREISQHHRLTEKARPLYDSLISHAGQLVPTGKVVRICGSVNEEYERELQQEVEEERQRELPPRAHPSVEAKWPFDRAIQPNFIEDALKGLVSVLKLVPLKQLFTGTILDIDWSENKAFELHDVINNIYLTHNFASTVQSNTLSDYIRPLDVVIKFNGQTSKYLLVSLFEANELIKYIQPNPNVEFCHLHYMHGTNNDEHRCITLLKLLNGQLSFMNQEKTALLMLLSLVPDKIDFIDQTMIGLELSPAMWMDTWNTMARFNVLDKHNGFVEERDDIQPPQGPHSHSLIKFISSVVGPVRMFRNKPLKFIHDLLTLRDTIRDYNYSDLHSLFGTI